MQAFILETVVPLLRRAGELWIDGNLQVFQEHFLSGQLIRFLNTEISAMQINAGKPLVILATLPGEKQQKPRVRRMNQGTKPGNEPG